MQKLAEICIARPVFACMLVLAMVVAGAVGFARLPVDRYPAFDLPSISVRTVLTGASPEEVEVTLSQPIEEAINTVAGITELRSISSTGTSLVLVTFDLDRDIDVAAQDVRDRIATVVRRLPRDIDPPVVSKFDNDSSPVLSLALSGERPLRELTEFADKKIKRRLERERGVGEVRLEGGRERTINIWVDADRLAAYGMPITRVREALARQNSETPGGSVSTDERELVLRTMGRVRDPTRFDELVVETRSGTGVRIADLGRAEDGTEEPRTAARLDGVPCIVLEVRRQSGENTVAVITGLAQHGNRVGPTERAYLWLLRICLRYPIWTLLLATAVAATSAPLYQHVRQDYIPSDVDEGEFDVQISGPDQVGFAAMDAAVRAVEAEVR